MLFWYYLSLKIDPLLKYDVGKAYMAYFSKKKSMIPKTVQYTQQWPKWLERLIIKRKNYWGDHKLCFFLNTDFISFFFKLHSDVCILLNFC